MKPSVGSSGIASPAFIVVALGLALTALAGTGAAADQKGAEPPELPMAKSHMEVCTIPVGIPGQQPLERICVHVPHILPWP